MRESPKKNSGKLIVRVVYHGTILVRVGARKLFASGMGFRCLKIRV